MSKSFYTSQTYRVNAKAGDSYKTCFWIKYEDWINQEMIATIEHSIDKLLWYPLVVAEMSFNKDMPNPTWIAGSHKSEKGGGYVRLKCEVSSPLSLEIKGEVE